MNWQRQSIFIGNEHLKRKCTDSMNLLFILYFFPIGCRFQITKWIQNDGESMLKKYADVPLDSETSIKNCEHDFEKFYFISMVHFKVFDD